jgi:bifunctional non-homologous end joining protein LigD
VKPSVPLTNPDRLVYPRDRISKRDVADYYHAVSGPMVRALKDRPIQFAHWPDGIDEPSWFQQNIGGDAEPWMTLVTTVTRTSKRPVRHLIPDRPEALRWLAQHSALEIHAWSSRARSLEEPDWVVFDLDPPEGSAAAVTAGLAQVMHRFFDRLEMTTVVKTSGRRGLHLYVPIAKGHSHEQAVAFARQVGRAVTRLVPGVTMERSPEKRAGRLYLDCFQNGRGKTLIAPYSLRARDGAPVSTPLRWSEVTRRLDPSKLNLRTVPDRVARFGDLFAPALEGKAKLPKLG